MPKEYLGAWGSRCGWTVSAWYAAVCVCVCVCVCYGLYGVCVCVRVYMSVCVCFVFYFQKQELQGRTWREQLQNCECFCLHFGTAFFHAIFIPISHLCGCFLTPYARINPFKTTPIWCRSWVCTSSLRTWLSVSTSWWMQ